MAKKVASWRGSTENFTYFGGTVYKQNGKAGTKYSGSKGCVNIPPNKMPIIFLSTIIYDKCYYYYCNYC